ncbi:helix-turn-helix domain-containing protein [Marinibaculum pumilum]|uniref:Helix-turn-helix domain-containing protein n=1 Tax=Marinibaculum pumilum TaxID=1766165 RepID=A0ABV7L2D5_9PROT
MADGRANNGGQNRMSLQTRQAILSLRREGWTYSKIAKAVGVATQSVANIVTMARDGKLDTLGRTIGVTGGPATGMNAFAGHPEPEKAFGVLMFCRRHTDAVPPSKRHPTYVPHRSPAMQSSSGVSDIYGADARPLDFGAHQ